MAFAKFTGVLIPSINDSEILLQIGFVKITTIKLLAIFSIVLLSYINSKGVSYGKLIQNIFGSTKIIAIILLIVLGALFAYDSDVVKVNFDNIWNASRYVENTKSWLPLHGYELLIAIGMAMVGALFSSDAWNNVSFAGDEIVNPKKTIALSLAIGTALVTLIYISVNLIYCIILYLI